MTPVPSPGVVGGLAERAYRSDRRQAVERTVGRWSGPGGTEALKHPPVGDVGMSDATKIVLGTVAVAGFLAVVIVLTLAL